MTQRRSLARVMRGVALATAGASALYAFRTRRRAEKTIPMAQAATSHPIEADADPTGRTLIAAAATAATAGAVAADDPAPAPAPPSRREREFRLHPGEAVADGIRRAARGRLADSAAGLAGVTEREELGEAIHSTRKSIKRVRATLRLSRDAIGAQTYREENATLRAIAGRLSGARDAEVLIDTLHALEQRFADDLSPWMTERLHVRLDDDRTRALAAMAGDGDLAVTTRQALDEAGARTAQWRFQRDGFGAVKPGLRRVYSRGAEQMRAACDEPGAEHLHDARKRVKDLWHACELLHETDPKRMKRLARDAHKLSALLGDHHDLSVLRDYAESNPQLFSDMSAREALLDAIDRRSETLQDRALERGRRFYRRPAKRFVKDVARGWEKRMSVPG